MDRNGIQRSIVTGFTPPDLDFPSANRGVARAVRDYPDRFIGAVRIDPRLRDVSRDEVRQAVETYGFRGVALHPAEQGFQINHPLVLPCIELVERLGLFVHIPTGYPVFSTPTQVAALARRFPAVPFLMGHMGLNSYLSDTLKVLSLYPNLYAETAGHVVTGEMKSALLMADRIGRVDRIVFATDAPYFDPGVELLKIRVARLPSSSEALVLGGNILRLLGQH